MKKLLSLLFMLVGISMTTLAADKFENYTIVPVDGSIILDSAPPVTLNFTNYVDDENKGKQSNARQGIHRKDWCKGKNNY